VIALVEIVDQIHNEVGGATLSREIEVLSIELMPVESEADLHQSPILAPPSTTNCWPVTNFACDAHR
jgi:hypothetical protein